MILIFDGTFDNLLHKDIFINAKDQNRNTHSKRLL